MKNVVFIGGGHSNTLCIRNLMQKIYLNKNSIFEKFKFHLISESNKSAYSGMIPGTICQYYSIEDSFINLEEFSRIHNCNFIQKKVIKIQPKENSIIFEDLTEMNYDLLSINVGSKTFNGNDVKGVEEFSLETRPINKLINKIEDFEINYKNQNKSHNHNIRVGIVGSGISGIELAFSIQYRFKNTLENNSEVFILSNDNKVIPQIEFNVVEEILNFANNNKIKFYKNSECIEIKNQEILFKNKNSKINSEKFNLIIWATGAGPQEFNYKTNLTLDERGFILVNERLQSIEYDNIFGAGDCIQIEKYKNIKFPYKSGVYAVREGAFLAENIYNFMTNNNLVEFQPQTNFLKLITMGDKYAYGTKFGIGFYGKWVWNLKEFIDVNFVKTFYKDLTYENTTINDLINSYDNFSYSPEDCLNKLKNSKDEEDFTIQFKIIDRLAKDEELLKQVIKILYSKKI